MPPPAARAHGELEREPDEQLALILGRVRPQVQQHPLRPAVRRLHDEIIRGEDGLAHLELLLELFGVRHPRPGSTVGSTVGRVEPGQALLLSGWPASLDQLM